MKMLDLKDVETKKAVDEMIKAAVDEATAGLVAKNSELLGKLKKAQKDSTIDPAEYQALQAELDATQTKFAELQKQAKTAAKEAEAAKKALEAESGFVNRLIIDNGLNDALIKAGVKPEMSKAVKALLSSQVKLKIEGDKRDAVIGDKPLFEAVDEWAKSDEGKFFVSAPANQGGGANGGGQGKGNAKTMTRAAYEGLDASSKMAFTKGGGVLI
jgi:hypothetical protein